MNVCMFAIDENRVIISGMFFFFFIYIYRPTSFHPRDEKSLWKS